MSLRLRAVRYGQKCWDRLQIIRISLAVLTRSQGVLKLGRALRGVGFFRSLRLTSHTVGWQGVRNSISMPTQSSRELI